MNQTATNMAATNILVVDDDQRLRDLLDRYLGEQGFGVHAVASAPAMDKVMGKEDVDMIILDLMLPGEDGMSVCRRLRAAGKRTPIIMLTAKGDEADRIAGLDVGADDYLPKPFNPRELVARINAVLRRQAPVASSPVASAPGAPDDSRKPVKFGPFEINLSTRTLTRNRKQVALTTGEFAMLKTLVTHPRVPLSRDRLMELARGREYGVFDRSIDVQVSRLRRLLEEDPAHPRYIQTVWGVGYVFVPDDGE
jgi:two-component system phosphate regulon response regulator OmpR